LLFSASNLFAQRVINKEIPVEGDILLTEGIDILKVNKGYTVWLPDTGKVNGMLVFTHSRRDTAESELIIDYALTKQLAVL